MGPAKEEETSHAQAAHASVGDVYTLLAGAERFHSSTSSTRPSSRGSYSVLQVHYLIARRRHFSSRNLAQYCGRQLSFSASQQGCVWPGLPAAGSTCPAVVSSSSLKTETPGRVRHDPKELSTSMPGPATRRPLTAARRAGRIEHISRPLLPHAEKGLPSPSHQTGLIREGIAVYLDQTNRDRLETAQQAFRKTGRQCRSRVGGERVRRRGHRSQGASGIRWPGPSSRTLWREEDKRSSFDCCATSGWAGPDDLWA